MAPHSHGKADTSGPGPASPIPALPREPMGSSLHFPGPQFPHLSNGGYDSPTPSGHVKIFYVESLGQGLAHPNYINSIIPFSAAEFLLVDTGGGKKKKIRPIWRQFLDAPHQGRFLKFKIISWGGGGAGVVGWKSYKIGL